MDVKHLAKAHSAGGPHRILRHSAAAFQNKILKFRGISINGTPWSHWLMIVFPSIPPSPSMETLKHAYNQYFNGVCFAKTELTHIRRVQVDQWKRPIRTLSQRLIRYSPMIACIKPCGIKKIFTGDLRRMPQRELKVEMKVWTTSCQQDTIEICRNDSFSTWLRNRRAAMPSHVYIHRQ